MPARNTGAGARAWESPRACKVLPPPHRFGGNFVAVTAANSCGGTQSTFLQQPQRRGADLTGGIMGTRLSVSRWLLAVASAVALAIALFDYFWPNNGIHGTAGALLVVASTAVALVLSIVLAV